MNVTITGCDVMDVRFPTSLENIGSDAMHTDPDYSCAYVTLYTDDPAVQGYGLTFTQGRGTDLCVKAAEILSGKIIKKTLSEITADFGSFWHELVNDTQMRWLGPEKGVVHLSTAAVVNALWDLWARVEGKPLWQLVADMSPEQLVRCIDFTYISDALTPDAAITLLKQRRTGFGGRIQKLQQKGLPAYTTSPGWIGYSDDKLKRLCLEALDENWSGVKLKVGASVDDDIRRLKIARETLGDGYPLMIDANQKWSVDEAIDRMQSLQFADLFWIEEPTCPDDILGHRRIRQAVAPVKVATGEQCQNRIIFKQFLQAEAIDICQIDSCRLGGVNEVLAVLLLAAHFNVPVCPHSGGVGLCEFVQHLAVIDYLCIGASDNSVVEYVEHLHEHFSDPVVMDNGCYCLPDKAGYSGEIKQSSLQEFAYPVGTYWQDIVS